MDYVRQSQILYVFLLSSQIVIAAPPTPSPEALIVIAEDKTSGERIEVAVKSDGSYAFIQFSDALMRQQYQGRSLTAEDYAHPAHFNYYDGQRTLISAAPFDPMGKFVSHTIPKPLNPGDSSQTKWCLWPLLDSLSFDWTITEKSDDATVAKVNAIFMTLTFDNRDRLTEIRWAPPAHDKAAISARWVYSDFQPFAKYTLPTQLEYTLKSTNSEGDLHLDQANNYTLTYDLDPEHIQAALAFTGADSMLRRDPKSGDIINPDGSIAYNEKELAKYTVPINPSGQSGRKPNLWFLFALAATAITTTLLILQRKKA